MTEDKTPRQQRRIAARKQQILEAAIRVFLDRGYYRATTKEIAEAADVSEGTIYNYFQSKDDLLIAMINSFAMLDERREFFDESLDMGFREFLTAYSNQRQRNTGDRFDVLFAIFPALMDNPEIRRRYNQEIIQPAMDMFADHIQKRIDRGEVKPIDQLPLVTRLLTAASLGTWLLILVGDPVILQAVQDPEAFTETALDVLYDQFIISRDDKS